MVLELHVWGPAFGLASIEPECIATIAYCQRVIPKGQWSLVAAHNPTVGTTETLPILFDDGVATASGFEDIVAYLRNYPTVTNDIDAGLSSSQQTDRTAFSTFLQSTATPLVDLSLYVSAENYNKTTSSAYTEILPWYTNYTVPPKRRDLARKRTAHMGLASLDVDTTDEEGFAPGRGTPSSEYEAAKQAAGIPTENQPRSLNIGRGRGLGGLLGGQVYAGRFRLDALSAQLLDPLSDLLGKHKYLFRGDHPSSLDCLAFGYLSLLVYPPVPQAWLRETIRSKYPRIGAYIHRLHRVLFQEEDIRPVDVWAVSTGKSDAVAGTTLPWTAAPASFGASALSCTKELLGNLPGIATLVQRRTIVTSEPMIVSKRARSELPSPLFLNTLFGVATVAAVGLASLAIHHRRSPREGELIFWALRPTSGLGEAGNILSVFANNLHDGVGAF
ncbi:protein targeting to mitochondrion [Curvularia clavata]|uniref:Protein targeting to mitochondrion n=1 Tax=Curvularia clavata TaxID=95742 RepID=A0A9Q9DYA0_CURCL|nr:protein targeting to mitochondrion [Curvularia clavata]